MKLPRTRAFLLAAILFLLLQEFLLIQYISDDAFISFRYAENLTAGKGLVFNEGERVEGYSNFLWVLILSGCSRVGLDLVWSSKVLGIFFSILNLLLVFKLSKSISGKETLTSLLSVGLVASDVGFARWAIGGLETHLFLFFALLSAHLLLLEDHSRFPLSSLCFALAALTRVEGALLFVVAGVVRLLLRLRQKTWTRRDSFWVLGFLVVYLPYVLWRVHYYHSLLPNVYYAKTLGGMRQVIDGFVYAFAFIVSNGGPILFLLALIPLFSRKQRTYHLYAFLFGYLFFVIYVGGDWMPDFRLLLPILPLFFVLTQEGLREMFSRLGGAYGGKMGRAFIGICLLLVFSSNLFNDYHKTLRSWFREPGKLMETFRGWNRSPEEIYDRAKVGLWLKERVPPNSLIALDDCGMIPYFSGLRTLDLVGVLDAHIGHLRGRLHRKYDVDYYLSREPDYFVLITHGPICNGEAFWLAKADEVIFEDERFQAKYKMFHLQKGEGLSSWFLIYQKRQDGP